MKPSVVKTVAVATAIVVVGLAGAPVAGQGTPALFPAGYPGYDALTTTLRRTAEAHPDRVRLVSIGKTLQGRDVWLVTLSRNGGEPVPGDPKPELLVVANLEADHVIGSVVALGLIERLAADQGKDAAWLDRCVIHVVPRLNPDGAERTLATPLHDFRGNVRPLDRDRDGRGGEDGPDDLDGDGVAVRMRYRDPAHASLVPDEKDPRILRPANPARGQRALYAEEAEGLDNDGDGLRNEDPPSGVNLNRNWPYHWTEFDPEAGLTPASEPAVHALIRFAFDHPGIVAVWSFSLADNLREEPKNPAADVDDGDLPLLAELSRAYNKMTAPRPVPPGGSPAGKGTPAPGATIDGSLAAWAYHQFGALGLATRIWSTPEIPPPLPANGPKETQARPAVPDDGEARWLFWNDHVAGGHAFVPFHAFTHPTLGPVEIGGWRPGVRINPPITQVAALTETHVAFLHDLAARMPRLDVPEVKAEPRGGGLFEVKAVVRNDGYLPTALVQGVRSRKAPPILVTLDPAGATILAGRARDRLDTLAGSGGRHEFRWLLQATDRTKEARLQVTCPRAGRVVVPVRLD